MRILHGDGFRLREREEARETVISNLVRIFTKNTNKQEALYANEKHREMRSSVVYNVAGHLCVSCHLSDGVGQTLQ